jgi:hypothetical protein
MARSVRAGTAHGTAHGAHARCARPPTVEPRTPRPRRTGHRPGPGGGVVRLNGEPSQRRRTALTFKPAGRLSRYPTRTPAAVSGHVQTRSRRLRAVAGRSWARRGVSSRRFLPHSVGAKKGPTPTPGVPCAERDGHSCWLCPLGGVERTGRVDVLRAIDSSAGPRSWRNLRSAPPAAASQPDLVVTHRDTAGPPWCGGHSSVFLPTATSTPNT